MANLCVACCHKVNGVAELHSNLVKTMLFKDFVSYYEILEGGKYKNKFMNVTNGVTPRRWMSCANPDLCKVISEKLGHSEWIT